MVSTSTTQVHKELASAIRVAGSYVFDHITLILNSAKMNKTIIEQLQSIVLAVASKYEKHGQMLEKTKPDRLFQAFVDIACFRDSLFNVFHGSILNSLMDNNFGIRTMIEIGRCLTSTMKIMEADLIWREIEKVTVPQSVADLRDQAAHIIENELTEASATDLIRAFDTTYDYLKEDVTRCKGLGVNKDMFKNVNDYDKALKMCADTILDGALRMNLT